MSTDNQDHKHGEITSVKIWCDNCKDSHEISTVDLVALCLNIPDSTMLAKIGQDLVKVSLTMLTACKAANFTYSRFISPYSTEYLDRFLHEKKPSFEDGSSFFDISNI